MEKITRPRGTKDALPGETDRWRRLEAAAANTALRFGFGEIRFPAFEHTELFVRGVGDTTDVVQKEMYTFNDKGGRSITLRPEGTASAVRAAIENGLFAGALPLKMFYIAPMFRYETPQSGRLREHHQFGAECFGAAGPDGDLEVIMLANTFLNQAFTVDERSLNMSLRINSIGCADCREAYRSALLDYLSEKQVCKLCAGRMERNPLRVLDCKDDNCKEMVKNAPSILHILCGHCSGHFDAVKTGLTQMGLKYEIDDRIVRGLDYYNGPVFEFVINGLTVLGGGRYDGLAEQLGGAPVPACGFGCGLERVMAVQDTFGVGSREDNSPWFYVAVADKPESPAAIAARALTNAFRVRFAAELDICARSLKAQLRHADRIGAKFLIIIGEDEVKTGQVTVKRMADGETFKCAMDSAEITGKAMTSFAEHMKAQPGAISICEYGKKEN